MGDFKKFIDTSGKSPQEIRKSINDMLLKAAEDNAVKYAKNRKTDIEAMGDRGAKSGEDKVPYRKTTSGFNYITGRREGEPAQLDKPNPIAYPPEAIPEKMSPYDEYILHKIREMRSLQEVTHNSYIVKQCAQITMVRQGEYMADIEDDYVERVPCGIPYPIYAALSNSQLRNYFSWRTKVRRGVYEQTEQSYVLLYCFELLNRIGTTSANDAFKRLVAVWERCNVSEKFADSVIPRWIKDYYAFNDVTLPLPEQIEGDCQSIENYQAISEIKNGNFLGKLDYLAKYSDYSINDSQFLNEKTRPMMDGALAAVLGALSVYLEERGASIFRLICGKMSKDESWEPFRYAIVDIERMDGPRTVWIGFTERYSIEDGEPVLERFEQAVCRGFVGYVLKSVEAALRKITGYGHRLAPNIKMMESDIQSVQKAENLEEAISDPQFAEIIFNAVEEYCLGQWISSKAEVCGGNAAACHKADNDALKFDGSISQQPEKAYQPIVDEPAGLQQTIDYEEVADRISEQDFNESVAEYAELISEDENPAPNISAGNRKFEEMDPDWQRFAGSLTSENILFLRAMLEGSEREFCRERDILPQTMIAEINEEAIQVFRDAIIDGGRISEYYAKQVRRLVESITI